ncbi:MAG: hypothetical protein FJW30_14215 [Acidobacteria bacterium]|nr:hypothetical protein [Acidobacteriota bacterium]
MAIDVASLDEQIQRLQDIRRIVTDPKSVAMLQEFLGAPQGSPVVDEEDDEATPNGQPSQISLIRRCIHARSGAFTVTDIGDDMRAQGATIKNIAIGRALQRLASKYKEIELVKKGEGSSPNVYKATDKLKV